MGGFQRRFLACCSSVLTILAFSLLGGCTSPVNGAPCVDEDGDGYGRPDQDTTNCEMVGLDCNDNDPSIHPLAEEGCDGQDTDCDGVVAPEEDDGDGDGVTECDGDCDDTDATVYLGAAELCDGIDNDCDGEAETDETDGDGDGFSPCADDCDDADADVYPGADDICDGVDDNDCDGATDPSEDDGDGDGFSFCDGDCDDTAADVHPGAPDTCDDVDDNDCDGVIDPMEDDGDGDGYSECDGDCDPADDTVFPGADEICGDGVDQSCDGGDPWVPNDEIGFCHDGLFVGTLPAPVLPDGSSLAIYGNSGADGDDTSSGLVDNVEVVEGLGIAFEDTFDGDLSAYTTFGDPESEISPEGNPAPSLMTAGDDCGTSGVTTNQTFDWDANGWDVTADLLIGTAADDHQSIVAVMDGTVVNACGGDMPLASVRASYTGVDDTLRFSVTGQGSLAVSAPGVGVWQNVQMIKP